MKYEQISIIDLDHAFVSNSDRWGMFILCCQARMKKKMRGGAGFRAGEFFEECGNQSNQQMQTSIFVVEMSKNNQMAPYMIEYGSDSSYLYLPSIHLVHTYFTPSTSTQ